MKVGTPIRAELLYPVYADDQLVLPAKTIVTGTVVALRPNHARRVRARLGGDFTPLRSPVVRFTSIVGADGAVYPITTDTVSEGAPLYRLVAPPPQKGGLFSRGFAALKTAAKDRIHIVTGPDKADRLTQFVYSQLPYHPQRIAKATTWTTETSAPVSIPAAPPPSDIAGAPASSVVPPPAEDGPPTRILQAYLTTPVCSETSRPGDKISATIAEPVLNADGSVAVPEGSLLTGEVTQAKPSRRLSRAGKLRFSFRQLQLPGQEAQSVRASLTGADSASDAQLAMDSEGNVKPKPQDKLVVPLILLAFATLPLHEEDHFGKNAIASNSFGLVGFIIGTAAQQPSIAAGIGYYGAAVSLYQRIFAKGKPVAFTKDTRVVIQTTTTRSASMKPATH